MKNIGIFGGSFNPIHNAHIKLAQEAFKEANLDEMLIIPTFLTNLKNNDCLVNADQRLEMCNIVCSKIENFKVLDIEVKRGRTSYTSETIEELLSIEEASYYVIMGADSYKSLYKWHNYEYILNNSTIIVAPRNDEDFNDLIKISEKYIGNKPIILRNYIGELSSTFIRKRLSQGEDVSEYLDCDVLEYIKNNNLY